MSLYCMECGSDYVNSSPADPEIGQPELTWCEGCGNSQRFSSDPPADPPHVDRTLDLTTRELYLDVDTTRLYERENAEITAQEDWERQEEELALRMWSA